MTTQQTHCFGCRQFENGQVLKLFAYLTTLSLCLRRQVVATDDRLIKSKITYIWQIFSKLLFATVQ